jgi:hypothetical protein
LPDESTQDATASPSDSPVIASALYHPARLPAGKNDGVQSGMLLLEDTVAQESEERSPDPRADGEGDDVPRSDGEEGSNLIHVRISLKLRAATPAVTQSPAMSVNTNICDSSTFARIAMRTVSAMPKATGIQPRLPLVTNSRPPPVKIRSVPLNFNGSRACATSVLGVSAIALAKGKDSPPP